MRLLTVVRTPRCPACTEDMLCVACYLDLQTLDQLEDAREAELEGYQDA